MAKLKWLRRVTGRDAGGRDDLHEVRLKPDPIMRDITLNVAEEGLRLMGVSLDDLINGREVHPEPPIEISKGEKFLRAVLVNHAEYNIRAMPLDMAGSILSVIGANFFFHASKLVRTPRPIHIGSWSPVDSENRGLVNEMRAGIMRRIRARTS